MGKTAIVIASVVVGAKLADWYGASVQVEGGSPAWYQIALQHGLRWGVPAIVTYGVVR